MRVTTTSSSSRANATRRTGSGRDPVKGVEEFSRYLADAIEVPTDVASVDSPLSVGGIESLLAAQALGNSTEEEGRKYLVNQGEEMLDRLDLLREGLLLGRLSLHSLRELEALVQQRRHSADAALLALLDDIELRVQVELAKLDMATASAKDVS